MDGEDDQRPANRRWFGGISDLMQGHGSANGRQGGNVWGLAGATQEGLFGGWQADGKPQTPRRVDSLQVQARPAGLFGQVQSIVDSVLNAAGCAPDMTWSHRAQLEDGTLVERGAADQVVIPIDSGGEEENGEDEGADDKEEEEEDAGHVSLRPRSTTSRLPITAESTFHSLKGRMWGKTRDTKYVKARNQWKDGYQKSREISQLQNLGRGTVDGVMVYMCIVSLICAVGFIFYVIVCFLMFPLPDYH